MLHLLSGGVDSAIVLACLERTSGQVLCLNYRAAESESDERDYARLGARKAACELIEIEMPAAGSLGSLLSAHPLTAAPSGEIFGAPTKRLKAEIARERGIGAFLSGEGGDHLFFQMATALVAADYVRDHGINRRFLRVIHETALWTGESVWSVLKTAAINGLLRQLPVPAFEYAAVFPPFLSDEARCLVATVADAHPWLRNPNDVPPGKALQIAALANVLNRHGGAEEWRVADVVHPLLSQPVIELVLRIPSWLLTIGGQGRALARRAFAADAPAAILARQTKGGTIGHFARLARGAFPTIRGFLLDGLLVQGPVIDHAILERWLSTTLLQRGEAIPLLFKLLATEAWLRAWHQAAPPRRHWE